MGEEERSQRGGILGASPQVREAEVERARVHAGFLQRGPERRPSPAPLGALSAVVPFSGFPLPERLNLSLGQRFP